MKLAQAKVHFVGIGGIGMSGLAELLHNMGATVTGSDLAENALTQRLKSMGIQIYKGHQRGQLGPSEVVVYSSAVKLDNPELKEAREKKIPIIPRAEVLAEIMRLRRGVAIGGTHGKTTTTSMVASVFIQGGLDPTIVVGGRLDLIKSNALLGHSEWLVAEADESDGSFVRLSPEIAVITNIDNDHLDHYKSIEGLERAFVEFAQRIPFYGAAIVCGDDPRIQKKFKDFNKRIIYYGFEEHNDFILRGQQSHYEVLNNKKVVGEFDLNLPGKHNALNALAAIVVGLEVGLSFDVCANGIRSFVGVDRRFQWKGQVRDIQVFDDYGHHPTEVRSVLQAMREKFPKNKIKVLFQPHRYSRTKICWDEFLDCFEGADHVYLTDIYPAGEAPIEGITSEQLAKQISKKEVEYSGSLEKSMLKLVSELEPGDVVLTLGAGDVSKAGPEILKELST